MLDKVTSLAARWTTLRVELAIPAEVVFHSERLSHLDMIADRLQQALITVPSTFTSLSERLERALGSQAEARSILHHHSSTAAFGDELTRYLAALRLGVVRARVEETGKAFTTSSCSLATNARQILNSVVGNAKSDAVQLPGKYLGDLKADNVESHVPGWVVVTGWARQTCRTRRKRSYC
jgi:hypothetical protein